MDAGHRYLVGIDAGGTGCRVAIAAPDGRRLAQASGGAANTWGRVDTAAEELRVTLEKARRIAGLSAQVLRRAQAHAGLAGMVNSDQEASVRAILPIDRLIITEDRQTMLAGALDGTAGSLAALGTGTFLARVTSDGATQFIGGWGLAIADQASGAWLGRAALEQTVLAAENLIGTTDLLADISAQFAGSIRAISDFSQAAAPVDFGHFAPAVMAAARARDSAALGLVERAVLYLSQALAALGHRPGSPLCLAGGLGPHYAPFLPDTLRRDVIPAKGSALDGALRLAAKAQSAAARTKHE